MGIDIPKEEEMKNLWRDYPYLNNCYLDVRLAGFPLNLSPYGNCNSSPRIEMFAKHFQQYILIDGCEFPEQFTGVEYDYSQYTLNQSKRREDVEIIQVIPRYIMRRAIIPPFYIVICRNKESNTIGYFQIDRYFQGSDGFGFMYDINKRNFGQLVSGNTVSKDVVFAQSPAIKGSKHCTGVNLITAYVSMKSTIQDAMMISESAARKLESTGISSITLNVKPNQMLINVHGDANEPKVFPDIGERVTEGILCVLRNTDAATFAADQDPSSSTIIYPFSDEIIRIHKDSTILNIQVITKKDNDTPGLSQLDDYREADLTYYSSIERVYQTLCEQRQVDNITPQLSTLITNALNKLIMLNSPSENLRKICNNRKNIDMRGDNGSIVDNIQIIVTYSYKIKAKKGTKITDRNGNKGVVAKIVPDEEMPFNEYGLRAELITSPDAPGNRMNTAQFYEHGISALSLYLLYVKTKNMSLVETYDYMMEWAAKINSNFVQLFTENVKTNAEKIEFVQEWRSSRIFPLHVPYGLDTISTENMVKWQEEYGFEELPLSIFIKSVKGEQQRILTKKKFVLGHKYIFVLCKVPRSSGVSIPYVNQIGVPTKLMSKGSTNSTISMTPGRWGEDEFRILYAVANGASVRRLMLLLSASPLGLKTMTYELLTAKNTTFEKFGITNKQLFESSSVLSLLRHVLMTTGIDMVTTNAIFETPPEVVHMEDLLSTGASNQIKKQMSKLYRDIGEDNIQLDFKVDEDDDDIPTKPKKRKVRVDKDLDYLSRTELSDAFGEDDDDINEDDDLYHSDNVEDHDDDEYNDD